MDRWVENPPVSFLQIAKVWIQLHKIPVNHFTLKTMDRVTGAIEQVKMIAYDLEKPHLQEYVRVVVEIDLSQPVQDTKSLTSSKGSVTTMEVEYEKIYKKCFHCMRFTHGKQRCPLLVGQRNRNNSMENLKQKQKDKTKYHR